MKEEKDINLINIYIRIHNKQVLTMDDLAYLVKYNPDCFKKTCDNLIYKMPEAKALVEPVDETPVPKRQKAAAKPKRMSFEATAEERLQNERVIRQIIKSLKKIESGESVAVQNIDVGQVKELLGDLYMESLFPHSGLQEYFDTPVVESGSRFNARA